MRGPTGGGDRRHSRGRKRGELVILNVLSVVITEKMTTVQRWGSRAVGVSADGEEAACQRPSLRSWFSQKEGELPAVWSLSPATPAAHVNI